MKPNFCVAAARGGEEIAQALLEAGIGSKVEIHRDDFPDGETGLRFDTPVKGKDFIIVGTVDDDVSAFDLYALACAAVQYKARSLRVVVLESDEEYEVGTPAGDAQDLESRFWFRNLLSIPQANCGNRFYLHTPGYPILTSFTKDGELTYELEANPLEMDLKKAFGVKTIQSGVMAPIPPRPQKVDTTQIIDGEVGDTVLIASPSYGYLADELEELGQFIRVKPKWIKLADREAVVIDKDAVCGKNVLLVAGTPSETDLFALLRLAHAIVEAGARQLRIVCPYFGWQTMERADKSLEVVTAKVAARLISAIPRAILGNSIQMFDLHAAGIPHYFEDSICREHIYCKSLTMAAIIDAGDAKEFRVSSGDVGRFGWVVSLSSDITEAGEVLAKPAGVFKIRLSKDEVAPVASAGDVDGFNTVLFDDFTRTGGTISNAAKLLREKGATNVSIVF